MNYRGLANGVFLGALLWLLLWQSHKMAWNNGAQHGWMEAQRHVEEMQRLHPPAPKELHAGS